MKRPRRHVAAMAAVVAAIGIGLCLASAELSFAARRSHPADRQSHAPVRPDRSVTQQPYNSSRLPAYHPQGTSRDPWGPGYNLPYPDRPYGAPDRW